MATNCVADNHSIHTLRCCEQCLLQTFLEVMDDDGMIINLPCWHTNLKWYLCTLIVSSLLSVKIPTWFYSRPRQPNSIIWALLTISPNVVFRTLTSLSSPLSFLCHDLELDIFFGFVDFVNYLTSADFPIFPTLLDYLHKFLLLLLDSAKNLMNPFKSLKVQKLWNTIMVKNWFESLFMELSEKWNAK